MNDILVIVAIVAFVWFFMIRDVDNGGNGVDQCKGVLCNDLCQGTTLFYDGRCINGACEYEQQANSQQCSINPCLGIACPDYCSGYTLYYNGVCGNGQCSYSLQVNSPICGYLEPAVMKVAYLSTGSSCSSNDRTFADEIASKGYSVLCKPYLSWTLAELRNYSVMVMGMGASTPSYSAVQSANKDYGIPFIEVSNKPNNGVSLGYLTLSTIASCIQTASAANIHPITDGLTVGQKFSMCVSPACQQDCPTRYANAYSGTSILNWNGDAGKPIGIAVESSGTHGRYVWLDMAPVSMPVDITASELRIMLKNAVEWCEAA